MRTRSKVITFVILTVTSASVALLTLRPTEPRYKGKPLSYWTDQYLTESFVNHRHGEAETAIQAIGTNAIPLLLTWGKYKPAAWTTKLNDYVPAPIYSRVLITSGVISRAGRSHSAIFALSAFRTNADKIVPQLTPLMREYPMAIEALALLGPQGMRPLLTAWSNSTNENQRWALEAAVLRSLRSNTSGTNFASLIQIGDPESYRRNVSNAFSQIASQIATNTSAQ